MERRTWATSDNTAGDNVAELPKEYRPVRLVTGNRIETGFILYLHQDDEYGHDFYIVYYSDLKTVAGSSSGELVLRTYDYEFTIKGRHLDKPIRLGSGVTNQRDVSISVVEAIRLQKIEEILEWGKQYRDVPESELCIDRIVAKKSES